MTVYAFINVDDDGSAAVWYRLADVGRAMGEWPGFEQWPSVLDDSNEGRIDFTFHDAIEAPDDPDLPHALFTEAGVWLLAARTGMEESSKLRLASILATAEVCRMVARDGDQ